MLDRIKKLLQQNRYLQMIGAVLLLLSFAFMLLHWTLLLCLFLLAVGGLDLILIYFVDDITISTWIRNLIGNKVDTAIWLTLTAAVIYLAGWYVGAVFVMGFLNNHFFAND